MAKPKSTSTDKSNNTSSGDATTAEQVIDQARYNARGTRETLSKEGSLSKKEKIKAEEIIKELEKMYDPKNFIPLVRAPSDIMILLSGREKIWKISDNELNTLATYTSTTCRYFVQSDPKWVALTLLALSFSTIYGTRAALHYRDVIKENKNNDSKPT